MSADELIKDYYKSGENGEISFEELSIFNKEYLLLKELKKEYLKGTINRKELGQELEKRTKNLKLFIGIFEDELKDIESLYKYPDYITDYKKAFEILLRISNSQEQKYALKEFKVGQLGHIGTNDNLGMINGRVWIISEKKELDLIDNSKVYYNSEFSKVSTNLLKQGCSLVVLTDHLYDTNITPRSIPLETYKTKFRIRGFMNDMLCYTFNDELNNAVESLDNYIVKYGGDIDNISVEDIIQNIIPLHKVKKINPLIMETNVE